MRFAAVFPAVVAGMMSLSGYVAASEVRPHGFGSVYQVRESSGGSISVGMLDRIEYARSLARKGAEAAGKGEYDDSFLLYDLYVKALREALATGLLLEDPSERDAIAESERRTLADITDAVVRLPADPHTVYDRMGPLVYEARLLLKSLRDRIPQGDVEAILRKEEGKSSAKAYRRARDQRRKTKAMMRKASAGGRDASRLLAQVRQSESEERLLAEESGIYAGWQRRLLTDTSDVVGSLLDDEAAVEFFTVGEGHYDDLVCAVMLSREWPEGVILPLCRRHDVEEMLADAALLDSESKGRMIWSQVFEFAKSKTTLYISTDGILDRLPIERMKVDGAPVEEQIRVRRLPSTGDIALDGAGA